MSATDLNTVIVGGGFYGCSLAMHLAAERGERVVVVEAGADLLERASYANQARVHHGYHYPRSLLTGLRSSLNFPRFVRDYADCIVDSFDKYYAIARIGSNVTADQFARFCERIHAPLEAAPREVVELFDPRLVDRVFAVREFAFDARRLRSRMVEGLAAAGVPIRPGRKVSRLRRLDGGIEVSCEVAGGTETLTAESVYTCVYSRTNRLLAESGLDSIPLKHEITEIALVELPAPLDRMGVTLMCGPYFSVMPFPALGVHSLTHVRYTPHAAWEDVPGTVPRDPYDVLERCERRSRVQHMLRDARRYLPALADARYLGSLWEVKTVLPRSEQDDSRPILYYRSPELPALVSVIGSKIDNIYDVIAELPAGSVAQGT